MCYVITSTVYEVFKGAVFSSLSFLVLCYFVEFLFCFICCCVVVLLFVGNIHMYFLMSLYTYTIIVLVLQLRKGAVP